MNEYCLMNNSIWYIDVYFIELWHQETETEHTVIVLAYQNAGFKNYEAYHPCADLVTLQPLPSHQLKEEKKSIPTGQLPRLPSDRHKQQETDEGIPLEGAVKKEGTDQRQEEDGVQVLGLTPTRVISIWLPSLTLSLPFSPSRTLSLR